MRKKFGEVIAKLIREDKTVYLIASDYGFNTFNTLLSENPDHFFNFGINEQATIGIAAGMALEGLKPYVYGIAPFLLKRSFEQVELDLGQQNVNVKIIACGDFAGGGPTHHIPNVELLCSLTGVYLLRPKSPDELGHELMLANQINRPFIFYLSRN